jgi:hypothetical protein
MPAVNLRKGALVRLDAAGAVPRAIVFPYNPESLVHSLQAPDAAAAAAGTGVTELIRFTLVLDGADALQAPEQNPLVVQLGVHPVLAALELLLRQDAQPASLGATVFVWGDNRILPVRLVELDAAEKLFDARLNPLHTNVHLTLRGWDGGEPGASALVRELLAAHRNRLEVLAQTVYTTSARLTAA